MRTGDPHFGQRNRFLRESVLTIYQPEPGVYDYALDLEYLKGFSREDQAPPDFCPRFPALRRAGNLQLEFAFVIIRLLVARRAVWSYRNGRLSRDVTAACRCRSGVSQESVGR